ncbi:melanophilin isoform X2 [Antechinus flavipes]|uniref:melanophilin isoform X2 n=1 Tax=Antechinus flavipes TaxID=38775 RepID=UPI002236BAB5|nr:melanophilin isoform X2 [Antechinus flavipes]
MGRKLDLSKLTDEEAKHIWEVVQRDFDLRKKEEERLEELKGKIQKESTKKELLSDQAQLNETHCRHCLQPYRFLLNSKRQCLDCQLYTCKKCGTYNRREQGWLCDPCQLARVVRTGSLEWYYEHVRARFKRFGSDKVMRSLWGRLHHGPRSSPALGLHSRARSVPDVHGGGRFSPAGGSGDSGQTSGDEALEGTEAPRPGREKRLLSVHLFDFDLDSDPPAQPRPQSPQLSPAALDGLQTLPGAPSASVHDEEAASLRDALISHTGLTPESRDFLEEQGRSSPQGSLPGDSSLERKPSPDGEATGSDQPQLQYFADLDTSDEDLGKTPKMAAPPYPSKRGSWTSSPESVAHSETQSLGPEVHTDADLEEEALKRKLGELTSKVSDKGGSSEEEEEDGQSGLIPGRSSAPGTRPVEAQQTGQTHGEENRLPDLEEQVPRTRTPDSALSELEDRVALTATEVQHAKREVSDIKSRIAALSAAGLPIKTWEKPRKKSNLQILPLQPSENSPGDENPEDSGVIKVMSRPHVQKRIFNNSLKLQDGDDGLFSRKSPYRGSLTQRNPNGKNRRVDHIFAKPVMTHQP